MNSWLASTAINIAIAGLITNVALLVAAGTNWLNSRTRNLEISSQIKELQRQQIALAAAQGTAAATPPAAAAPLIIQMPAQPMTGPTGPVGAGGPPGVPPYAG